MSNMPIIDVALGLTFMFLVLSFCATAVAEALTEWRQWRGRLLFSKLKTILGPELVLHLYSERRVADLASGMPPEVPFPIEPGWFAKIRQRPIDLLDEWRNKRNGSFAEMSLHAARQLAMRMNAKRLPSQIPESVFADVLLDWMQGVSLPQALREGELTSRELPEDLAELWQRMNLRANGDQAALRSELTAWFQQVTQRLTGEFKRKMRFVLYFSGFAIVLATNANTLSIASTLYGNPGLRAQVAATAEEMVKQCPDGADTCPEFQKRVRDALTQSSKEASSELLGWQRNDKGALNFYWWSPLGWLLTVLAIGMGADFWFGALKRIVSIKNAKSDPPSEPAKSSPAGTGNQSGTPRSLAGLEPIDINTEGLAPLKGFQPLRFAESNVHAFWMAQFSSLAYNSLEELQNSDFLERHKLSVTGIDNGTTQVFLFSGEQTLIVAFRGTEQLPEDWIADAKLQPSKQPWGVKNSSICVHKGFHGALDLVWPELSKKLLASKHPVWFTGHSLGGALAVLAAYRLVHCEGTKVPTVGGVYTFGQPRVGNVDLASSCSASLSQRIFRFVNSSDIVPLVPPLHYVHFGNVRYFDAAGVLHIERTLWERIAEQLTPALRNIGSENADWGALAKEHMGQRLKDHAVARYIQCLERIDAISTFRRSPPP